MANRRGPRGLKFGPVDEPATIDPRTATPDGVDLSVPYKSWHDMQEPASGRGMTNTPQELQYAMHPDQRPKDPYAPDWIDYLSGLLDGQRPRDIRRDYEKRSEMERMRRALEDGVLTDPRERLAYHTNPDEWGKSVSTNYGKTVANEGDTLVSPGYGTRKFDKTPGYAEQGISPSDALARAQEAMRLDMERADKATQRSIDWYNARSQRISAMRPAGRSSGIGSGGGIMPTGRVIDD